MRNPTVSDSTVCDKLALCARQLDGAESMADDHLTVDGDANVVVIERRCDMLLGPAFTHVCRICTLAPGCLMIAPSRCHLVRSSSSGWSAALMVMRVLTACSGQPSRQILPFRPTGIHASTGGVPSGRLCSLSDFRAACIRSSMLRRKKVPPTDASPVWGFAPKAVVA